MAIEEFGRSLLSQVHEQRRRQRKKRESYEKKAAIASVVVPVGVRAIENVVETKAANFLASEQMMARKNKVENAIDIGEGIENQEREIQASNLAGPEYFRAKITPIWEALARERYPEEFHGMGPYAELTAEQVGLLADREWEKHQQGIALSRRMGSMEDYQTMSALNTKDVRPTNIIDLVGRQVSTVFGGKSTQEREQDAIAAIENSNIFTTAEALNTLHDTYEKTTNLPVAYSYAEFIEKIEDVDKSKFAPQPEEELFSIGNKIYTRSKEMTWNADAEMWETSYVKGPDGNPVITEIKDLTDPNDKLRANQAVFNFGTQPRLHLSQVGINAWYNQIKEYNDAHKGDAGYLPLNPNLYADGERGIEQYELLAGIFQDVIKESENVKTDSETYLLLSQLFTQIINPETIGTLVDEIGQARDDLITARGGEGEARYGLPSSILDPATIGTEEEKMIPMTASNIEVFEEIIKEREQALYNYYREVAEKSQQISEGLIDSGGLTGTPPLNWQNVLTPGDSVTSSVSTIPDTTDYRTYFQQIKQQYEDDEITQEDWEYFQENGELPK